MCFKTSTLLCFFLKWQQVPVPDLLMIPYILKILENDLTLNYDFNYIQPFKIATEKLNVILFLIVIWW